MMYDNQQVMKAFKIYSALALNGMGVKGEMMVYIVDDTIRSLVDQFAEEMQCTVFVAGENIYMVPKVMSSAFHVSNESLRKEYLPKNSTNTALYTMYLLAIILFGEFYDGYQSINPTRDFLSLSHWLEAVNERILSIKSHDADQLKSLEQAYEYNWTQILDNWEPMDDLKEQVKNQDARTVSRLSLLNSTKLFLMDQELIKDIGNDEVELTEKAKIIVQRYYMEYEFNRGIIDFIYNVEKQGGHA